MVAGQRTIALLGMCLAATALSEDRVIGWRGDGSGFFADARPPTRFSEQENLRWKANIGQGCGAAIVVGDRLFVQAAPNALVCLDKTTGKEFWRRDHHAGQLDPKSPAAVLDAAMDDVGAFHVLAQKSRRLAKDAQDRADLEAKVKQGEARLGAAIRQVPGAGIGGYGNGGIYLIAMTPCSDGRTVVAVFPTGLAVAYDLEGKWLWSTSVRPPATPPKDYGKGRWRPAPGVLSTCPVVTREGIVVAVYGMSVCALEASSGKVLWQHVSSGDSNASPVVGVIEGESFVATGCGDVLRARDGLVVHPGQGPFGTCSVSPVFSAGVFQWVPLAVKVTAGSPPKGEVLWSLSSETMADLAKNCYRWSYKTPHLSGSIDFTSPVVVDGKVLYYGWGNRMTVLEAATGKVLAQHPPVRSSVKPLSGGVTKNWAYGGMIRAGDHLILAHDNGLVKIFPINDTFSPMQSCALPDDVYAQPVCDGPAIYFRTLNALYCFGDRKPPSAPTTEPALKEQR